MASGYSAGSAFSIYRLDLSGFDQDIAKIKRDIAALDTAAAKARTPAASTPAATRANAAPDTSAADQRNADAALRLAQARATLARAEGDEGRALSILTQGLAQNSAASEQATLRVQTAMARLQTGSGFAKDFGNSLKSGLLGIVGPAALAGAAIGGVAAVAKSFQDAFNFKAQLDASTTAINTQLNGVRDSKQVWSDASIFASKYALTQKDVTSAVQASVGVFRQSKASTEDILGTLLRLQQLSPEQGIEGAALALKELSGGSTASLVGRFEVSTSAAAKMRDEIKGGADSVKVLSDYLEHAGIGMDALANRTKGAAGKINDLAVAQERLQLAEAGQAGGAGLTLLQAKINLTNALANALSSNSNALYAAAKAQDGAYNAALARGLSETDAARAGEEARIQTLARFSDAASQAAVQQANSAAAATQHAQAQYVAADADDRVQASLNGVSGALADELQKKIDGSIQTEQMAQLQAQLGADSALAAQGLLGSGNQALILASKYGIAAAQAQFLIAQQQRLGAAAALSDQRAGERSGGQFNSQLEVQRNADAARSAARAQEAIQAARDRQVIATGSNNAKLDTLQRQALEAQKRYGAQSAEAIDAQTRVLESKSSAAGGRAKRAGAAKVSDQQRLNNTLIADQQRADDRAEQEAETHQKNILKIEKDYQEKSLQQQRQNEISKRQSQADFYDRLTSSDLNKGKGQDKAALQGINADYQAAFQKSQELAQQGRAKEASDYLALKQRQLEQELSYQEAVAKARADKDKGEEARLTTIQNLRRQAAAEEEKQLLEGGDQNQKARDDALAAEDTRYSDAQTKIQESSDRAAERKIANAERSGKAIDAENAKLAQQEGIYARLPSGSQGAPTAPTTPPSAPAPNAADVRPVNDAALLGAVQAQTDMQRGKFDAIIARLGDVERAVRQGRGGVAA